MKTVFILRYLISYLLISPLFPMVFRVGGVGFTPILHHFAFFGESNRELTSLRVKK